MYIFVRARSGHARQITSKLQAGLGFTLRIFPCHRLTTLLSPTLPGLHSTAPDPSNLGRLQLSPLHFEFLHRPAVCPPCDLVGQGEVMCVSPQSPACLQNNPFSPCSHSPRYCHHQGPGHWQQPPLRIHLIPVPVMCCLQDSVDEGEPARTASLSPAALVINHQPHS